jgi:hypothetical protein
MTRASVRLSLLTCLLLSAAAGAAAQPLFKASSKDGGSSLSIGLLAQPLVDRETDGDGVVTSKNACFRRLRLIAGGQVASRLRFFIESDSPLVGYHSSSTAHHPTILQDFTVSWVFRPEFQLEGGLVIVPVSYNATQSAASLLTVGYSPYSFLCSGPTTSRTGRDQGVQARGYLKQGHVEYRAGVFRGSRQKNPSMEFRYAGRVAYYPFTGQTGLFYTGTTLGRARLVSIGASLDHQGDYNTQAADVFVDLPLPNRDGVTLQADFVHYNGGQTFPDLPHQHTWLAEAGYYFSAVRLGVFGQVAGRDIQAPGAADGSSYQAGVAWWALGHRLNVKAGLARVARGAVIRYQTSLQAQFFAF